MALYTNQENYNNTDYNNIGNNDTAALLPHLESFEKMLKLPVVEAAWHQSQDVYGRVKGRFSKFWYILLITSSPLMRKGIFVCYNSRKCHRCNVWFRHFFAFYFLTHSPCKCEKPCEKTWPISNRIDKIESESLQATNSMAIAKNLQLTTLCVH